MSLFIANFIIIIWEFPVQTENFSKLKNHCKKRRVFQLAEEICWLNSFIKRIPMLTKKLQKEINSINSSHIAITNVLLSSLFAFPFKFYTMPIVRSQLQKIARFYTWKYSSVHFYSVDLCWMGKKSYKWNSSCKWKKTWEMTEQKCKCVAGLINF